MTSRRTLKRSELYSAPDLKKRGWTEASITRILGHWENERPNPYGKAPMRFWTKSKVESAEKTRAFQDFKSKSDVRSKKAKEVAEVKKKELLEKIGSWEPTIVLPSGSLRKAAIQHYEDLWASKGEFKLADSTNPEFLDRITVNYLRHECTDYDPLLEGLAGKIGKFEAYELAKCHVLGAIARKFPKLSKECLKQRQKALNFVEGGSL